MMGRFTDEERAAILAAGRQAIADAEATLADGYVSPVPWPAEDRVQRVARERAAERVPTAAAEPLTEWQAANLEHRLAGLVEQDKRLVLDVVAGVVAELRSEFAEQFDKLAEELGQTIAKAFAKTEPSGGIIDLPNPFRRRVA